MYKEHFKLTRKPFGISADPYFLWLGSSHRKTLSRLKKAADKGGVMVLTGDVGTGKTTLLNAMVQGLSSRFHTVKISNPSLELNLLFSLIARDLGFELRNHERFDKAFVQFLDKLLLLKEHCLVIVDEAQQIGKRLLKVLFSWQDMENGRIPLTVLLVGQNEFYDTLFSHGNQHFLKKTTLSQVLPPLNRKETAQYVRFRLSCSGVEDEIFTQTALDHISIFSKGYPRAINILCDQCLVLAHRKNHTLVDDVLVQSAAKRLFLPQESDSLSQGQSQTPAPRIKAMGFLAMASFIAVALTLFFVPTTLDEHNKKGLAIGSGPIPGEVENKVPKNIDVPSAPDSQDDYRLTPKNDPGMDTPDPGAIINWLLEKNNY